MRYNLKEFSLVPLMLVFGLSLSSGASQAGDILEIELQKAVEQSDVLAAARQAVLAAREDIVIARSSMDLSATLSATGTASQQSTSDADFKKNDSANLTVTMTKPLYDGGLADAREGNAGLLLDIARTSLGKAEQRVLLESLSAYIVLAAARDRLELEKRNLARLEEHLKATELKLNLGESTPTELAGTRARLARARASLIEAETSQANAEETYRTRIGTPPAELSMPDLPAGLPASAPEAGQIAEQQNLDHRLALLNERVSRKSLDVLVAQVRPTVDFSLSGLTTEATTDAGDKDSVSARITLSMPLFPSSSVRSSARAAVAEHRAEIFNLEDSRRQTILAGENAWRDFASNSAIIDAHKAELEAAILVRNGTQSEVSFGLKTFLDLLDAEQDVVNAELNLLIANRDQVLSAFELLASMGRLSATDLGLEGLSPVDDLAPAVNPLVARPFPALDYPD
ncbi:TolC family protein [Alphaproteobacteria bacterium LSUCC0684]